jgi:hypothetical protein
LWSRGGAPLATAAGSSAHLLHTTPQLILHRQILCALHRRHERRKRALLTREQVDSATLYIDELVHESLDAIRVRAVATHHLRAETNAYVALLLVEKPSLRLHVAIHFGEPPHLISREAEALLYDRSHPLAQALLERLASRRRRLGRVTLRVAARRHGNECDDQY